MPKSSSKKKKEKNADFKKTKLKVGKKKAVADNFTDTSFKSKAISLPTQSISQDKAALLTNSRNATFSELMTQLKHYSPGTRKDAIMGLKDLFHRHPHLLPLHLGTLVNAIVRLLIDDSSVVRKALQSFLSEFTPMLHPRDIHPFLPLLIVYTCSAMTHILEDIREDALKFMDLWVAAGGQVVVNGFWDKIMPNYVALLTSDSNASHASKLSSAMSFTAATPTASQSAGNRGSAAATKGGSASSGTGSGGGAHTSKNALSSLKAKCSVLESLAGFLEAGLVGSERGGAAGAGALEKDPHWFLRNFLATEHARRSFNLARTTISGQEGQGRRRKGKKRKSGDRATVAGGGQGPSVKKPKTSGGDDEDEDEDEEDESDDSEDDSSESDSEEEEEEAEATFSGDTVLTMAPIVSFANAHRHHHIMASSPLHPTIPQSNLVQSLFGDTGSSLHGSPSIPIRVFPQQGVASAVGAGAASSASSSASGSGSKPLASGGSTLQSRVAGAKQLISTLHPLLLSVWLDTAPNVFGSSSTPHAGPALEMAHLILRIWGTLWRAVLARPKTTATALEGEEGKQQDEDAVQAKQDEKWMDECLQSMLKHVLIYFPFGRDSVGMMDAKVASTLHEMNTLYCELSSLFLLASGAGKLRKVSLNSLKQARKAAIADQSPQQKQKQSTAKTSYQPSNKVAKQQAKRKAAMVVVDSSDDYDSEEEELKAQAGKDGMVYVQQDAPEWVNQVVDFVLDTLGFDNPEHEDDEDDEGPKSQLTTRSSDFTPKHLTALLPTLWTLLNCLETKRREWVFEALMGVFDESHPQSGVKKTILEFLSLIIQLQSHPHYTGTFTLMVPGARIITNNKALLSLRSSDREQQEASIRKLSTLLSKTLLKLPKMLWDLGADRPETSLAVLDLLAWIVTVAGDEHAGAAYEDERVQFLKTLQNYMALFFSVTVGGKNGQEKRLVLGPFSKLPSALQRRAVEIVYYSSPDIAAASAKTMPLMVAVQKCCQAGDLSDETRLYIKETLCIE
ncbi:hypothetical protein BGZ73_001773 [Actinomortierella ambigua]|nr:hypothetical protein BGZ73_001773 [Actinomortierella ambigua]